MLVFCQLRIVVQAERLNLIFLSNENVSQKYIYTCIYHMVTGYDLGHIKAPEYFRTGRNIIRTCTSLNIFSLPRVIEL